MPTGADEEKSERLTIRFPLEDLKALFGPAYKSKRYSDFIGNLCRDSLHALVVNVAYQQTELRRISREVPNVELLAKRVAEELAKQTSTKPAPPQP